MLLEIVNTTMKSSKSFEDQVELKHQLMETKKKIKFVKLLKTIKEKQRK